MITLTAEEILKEKEEPLYVSPETTLYEAVEMMVKKADTAVLVREGETIVGIWTERDLLRNVLAEGFDLRKARVGDHMSSPLISAAHTCTVFQLVDTFLGRGIRHLLIEKEGEYIGLLYARDVIRAGLTQRTKEFHELDEMTSWEYYEDWKWQKKKGTKKYEICVISPFESVINCQSA
jgi:signal-transduction protein with cAMP-binding, CBS, and nucleotidyltransferase domain